MGIETAFKRYDSGDQKILIHFSWNPGSLATHMAETDLAKSIELEFYQLLGKMAQRTWDFFEKSDFFPPLWMGEMLMSLFIFRPWPASMKSD